MPEKRFCTKTGLKSFHAVLLFLISLLLAGCTFDFRLWGGSGKDPEGLYLPVGLSSIPLSFERITFSLPPGKPAGRVRGDPLCLLGTSLSARDAEGYYGEESRFNRLAQRAFHEVLKRQGFQTQGMAVPEPFETDAKADLVLGGIVREFRFDGCEPWKTLAFLKFFGVDLTDNTKTAIRLAIEWHIYSAKEQAIIYKTRTRGYYRGFLAHPGSEDRALFNALRRALIRLSKDEGFTDLLVPGELSEGESQ